MSALHAHSKASRPPQGPRGGKGWLIAVSLGVVVVVGVGIAAVAVRSNSSKASATPTSSPGRAVDASSDSSAPLDLVSITPVAGATQVPSDATISVHFSAPLKAGSPTPSLSPMVSGSWQLVTPDTYNFVSTSPLVPSSTETVTVPGGAGGVVGANGKTLAQTTTAQFTVATGSTLRLQQLLAQLGYLPVGFVPAGPLTAPQEAAQAQQGSFYWRATEPASLTSQWTVGAPNVITKGAVMAFESQHNLTTDGVAGPAVWQQLLSDAAGGAMDPNPYNYVYVSKSLPETASVYSNGALVYSTRANTGVAGAPTAAGTFPVYSRYKVTTMRGTNPDGSKYVDPGIPWVSYFNGGDALHGFVRGSYGYPQSDGCVEMPPANAAVVFPLTPIGTLVTVSA
jgi:peptidoglycan hydrolase-like protein with peptidoglycan-binding domain